MFADLPRVSLASLPTPIQELERLGKNLGGPRIYVKRDDLTGLATGGNKARKLEFLVADALAQGTDTLITAGAPQSNHARQTAAAAAKFGLRCILVLGPTAPQQMSGNLLIDLLVGARIRWAGDREPYEMMLEVAREERAADRKPYIIPYGGSNAIGASAYALAMDELTRQMLKQNLSIDHIVVPSSSGGTQAGLVVGARALNYGGRILGISVDKPAEELQRIVHDVAQLAAGHLGLRFEISSDAIIVNSDYTGQGYGIMGDPEREAIRLVASTEGLLLDPVYTGRAMAGLLDLMRSGEFSKDETVLFWHTGGTPALFAYAHQLV